MSGSDRPLDGAEIVLTSPRWPTSYEDMVKLWPVCGFQSPEQVAALFHQAYPHAPQDAHLANMISDIAAQAD